MWIAEREMLIERLMKIYPYPREWFERLHTGRLIAMYNKPSKKNNAAVLVTKRLPQAEQIRMDDPEDRGQTLVKTDGHGWQIEY